MLDSARYWLLILAESKVLALKPNNTGQLPLGEINIELLRRSRDINVSGLLSISASRSRSTCLVFPMPTLSLVRQQIASYV